jgi:hypothetical protein
MIRKLETYIADIIKLLKRMFDILNSIDKSIYCVPKEYDINL